MAIYRIHRFSSQQNERDSTEIVGGEQMMTSKDFQMENMKLQREIMRNQRLAQKLKEEERRRQFQAQQQSQRQEAKKDIEENKNQVRVKEATNRRNVNPGEEHPGLYKKSTSPVKPLSMK